jgi:hypothetical protein
MQAGFQRDRPDDQFLERLIRTARFAKRQARETAVAHTGGQDGEEFFAGGHAEKIRGRVVAATFNRRDGTISYQSLFNRHWSYRTSDGDRMTFPECASGDRLDIATAH